MPSVRLLDEFRVLPGNRRVVDDDIVLAVATDPGGLIIEDEMHQQTALRPDHQSWAGLGSQVDSLRGDYSRQRCFRGQ